MTWDTKRRLSLPMCVKASGWAGYLALARTTYAVSSNMLMACAVSGGSSGGVDSRKDRSSLRDLTRRQLPSDQP